MSFSQPDAPNATDVSNTQQAYNQNNAAFQNKNNSYNQSTPFGSLSYTADPNSPSGYSVNTSLSPQQQQLLNTRQGTQQTLGTAGNQLAANSSSMYSSPYDLNAATGQTAKLLNNWQQQYLQPLYNQQDSNLEARLQNQGLTPGSEAYNNAKNLLARNQGDTTNQYLAQNEGQAFNQAVQNYQLPLQTVAGLMGSSAPQGPTFQATPTAQVQPPNYQQAAQNQFAGDQQNFQNTISGVGQIAGLVAAPFTGGLSMVPGMFGSAQSALSGGGWSNYNTSLGYKPSSAWYNN